MDTHSDLFKFVFKLFCFRFLFFMVQDQIAISLFIQDFFTKKISTICFRSNLVSRLIFSSQSQATTWCDCVQVYVKDTKRNST